MGASDSQISPDGVQSISIVQLACRSRWRPCRHFSMRLCRSAAASLWVRRRPPATTMPWLHDTSGNERSAHETRMSHLTATPLRGTFSSLNSRRRSLGPVLYLSCPPPTVYLAQDMSDHTLHLPYLHEHCSSRPGGTRLFLLDGCLFQVPFCPSCGEPGCKASLVHLYRSTSGPVVAL
jgi:hypothetical protein